MATMDKRTVPVLALLFVVLIISIFFLVRFTPSQLTGPMLPSSGVPQEKISIQSIYYNSSQNCITVYMESTSIEVTLNNAIVKNYPNGQIIANTTIHDTLSDNHIHKTIVNLNMTLPSGNYTLTLISTKNSIFVSPRFNISYKI
jgi:hypothetical protein